LQIALQLAAGVGRIFGGLVGSGNKCCRKGGLRYILASGVMYGVAAEPRTTFGVEELWTTDEPGLTGELKSLRHGVDFHLPTVHPYALS